MPVKPKQEILDILAESGQNMRKVRTAFTQRELAKQLGEPAEPLRQVDNPLKSIVPQVKPER